MLEVGRHARSERRLRGKDDLLDAVRAARTGLAAETLTLPRACRVALVQLRSVIVTAPEPLRDELRRLPVTKLIQRCGRFRRSSTRTPDELAIVLALRSLARRIEAATVEADELEREILKHVCALVPEVAAGPLTTRIRGAPTRSGSGAENAIGAARPNPSTKRGTTSKRRGKPDLMQSTTDLRDRRSQLPALDRVDALYATLVLALMIVTVAAYGVIAATA